MHPEIPLTLYYSFLIFSVIMLIIVINAVRQAFPEKHSVAVWITLWFFVQYIAGKSGFFASGLGALPPKIMTVVVPNFGFIFYLWFSKKGSEIAGMFSLKFLTAIQSFRIGVEILLWQMAAVHLLPEEMSVEGRNFDIIVGLSAPVVLFLLWKERIGRKGLIAWNIAGLILVTNVVVHGMLAVPGIELIETNIPNFIISFAPFNLLPGFLVPIAYIGHVLSLGNLLKK